jgi:acetyl-CoA carboxylase biotin carboxyl carrier protein
MDLKRVEELVDFMRQSGLTHLSLELPDFKVSITRGPEGSQITTEGEPITPESQQADVAQPAVETQPPEATEMQVVAPVVGVFHNGGMLDPRELVRVGDRVEEGQLIAAIEAMKVPNELRAPVSGRVTRLLVEDGSAVEYGQALFVIEPEHVGEMMDDETPIGIA